MKSILHLLGISFAVIFFSQCLRPRQTAESSSDEGARLFIDNCARCHLATGAGGPAPGSTINGQINAPDIRQFNKTAPELREIITNGYGKMPSFRDSISDEDISKIAAYVAKQIEFHSTN